MTDTPPDDWQSIELEQQLQLKALFESIARGDEDGAERMILGFDAAERTKFAHALSEMWKTELRLYRRAAEIVARVIEPAPINIPED